MNMLAKQDFPSPLEDLRKYRSALGKFATGVAIATVWGDGMTPVGLTINSFTSVSLEPPIILWSLRSDSPSLAAFETSEHFSINILSSDQIDISMQFARPGHKFEGIENPDTCLQAPLIEGCPTAMLCRKIEAHPSGDHVVFFGEVLKFSTNDDRPLAYSEGRYGVFEPILSA